MAAFVTHCLSSRYFAAILSLFACQTTAPAGNLGWGRDDPWGALAPPARLSVSVVLHRPPAPAGARGAWAASGGAPLLTLGAPCAPCPLPSAPHPPSLAAGAPAVCLATHGGFAERSVWQAPRFPNPPQREEPLPRAGHEPKPAELTPPRATAGRLPRGQRTRGWDAPPAPGHRDGQRAAGVLPGGHVL